MNTEPLERGAVADPFTIDVDMMRSLRVRIVAMVGEDNLAGWSDEMVGAAAYVLAAQDRIAPQHLRSDQNRRLIATADGLHRITADPAWWERPEWLALGNVLDEVKPVDFWRNTGATRGEPKPAAAEQPI